MLELEVDAARDSRALPSVRGIKFRFQATVTNVSQKKIEKEKAERESGERKRGRDTV